MFVCVNEVWDSMRPVIFFPHFVNEVFFYVWYENLVIKPCDINVFFLNMLRFFWNTNIFFTLSITSYFFERFGIVNILSIRSSFIAFKALITGALITSFRLKIRIISTQNTYMLMVIVENDGWNGLINFSTLLMTLPTFYSRRLVYVADTENSRIIFSTG